ncbi:MAG: hypothetical protein ACRCTA_01320 [Bacilli bacterium]
MNKLMTYTYTYLLISIISIILLVLSLGLLYPLVFENMLYYARALETNQLDISNGLFKSYFTRLKGISINKKELRINLYLVILSLVNLIFTSNQLFLYHIISLMIIIIGSSFIDQSIIKRSFKIQENHLMTTCILKTILLLLVLYIKLGWLAIFAYSLIQSRFYLKEEVKNGHS